jgi:hypothetical protein
MIDIYMPTATSIVMSVPRDYKLLVIIMQSLVGSCNSIVSIVTRLCTGRSEV